MKRIISLVLSLSILMGLFSGLEMSVFATTSNTTITISNEFEEHMIGSSFAVSASYKSDTYSHNSETISYEISGPEQGLILDGGMSCIGTPDNGFISIPFKAAKTGTYIVTISSIYGATDSIEILVSEKTFNVYLASRLIDRKETVKNTNMLYHYIFDEPIDAADFMSSWVINDDFKANPEYYYETILLDLLLKQSANVNYIDYLNNNVKDISEKCISYSLDYFKDLDEVALKASKFSNMSAKDIEKLNESFEMSTGINNIWSGVSAFTDGVDTVEDYFNSLAKYATLRDVNHSYIDVLNLIYVYAVQDSEYNLNSALLAGACDKLIEIYSNKNVGVAECFENSAETIIWNLTKEVASEALSLIFGEAAALIEITKDVSLIMANSIFGLEDSIKSSCLVKANNYIEKYIKQGLDGISASFKNDQETYSEEYIACHELLISCFQYGNAVHTYYAALLYDKTPAGKIGTFINSNDKVIYEDMQRCFVKCDEMIADEYKYIESVIGEYKAYRYGNTTQWVITLNTNDEFGFETDVLVYDGDIIDLSSRIPKRNGYKFLGWYYDKECTIPLEENTTATTYLTLYANWEKEYIVVTDYDELTKTPFAEISYMSSPVTFSLSRNSSEQDTVISIPAYVDGYEITKIGDYGFAGCDTVTSIYMPDTVKYIGDYAFSNCTSLIGLIIPDSVTNIGEDILFNCNQDELTIYGYLGSYAESYAIKNQIRFIDINKLDTFSYDILDDGTIEITGYTGSDITINIPSVIDGYVVSSIGYFAFNRVKFIESITLPGTITKIDDYAFYGCSSIKNINIPNSVTSIGSAAFGFCTSLSGVSIGDNVTIIGSSILNNTAYANDDSNWENDLLYIGKYLIDAKNSAMESCNIKEGTTVIAEECFYRFYDLKTITIPESVAYICDGAFWSCSSLESLSIPNNVTKLSEYVFCGCSSLTNVTIPDNVVKIEYNAFSGCTNLKELTLPTSTELDTSMGSSFSDCNNIDKIILTKGNGTTQDYSETYAYKSTPWYISGCSEIIIENGAQIGEKTFYDCDSLTDITFTGVVEIGKNAFSGCDSLTNVYILDVSDWCESEFANYSSNPLYYGASLYCKGEIVTELIIPDATAQINQYAFYNYKLITKATIANSVEEIGYGAFSGCTGLTDLSLPVSAKIRSGAFSGCYNISKIVLTYGINGIMQDFIGDGYYGRDETCYLDTPWNNSNSCEVIIDDNITNIGNRAFYNCDSLTNIDIGDNVIAIGEYAFSSCDSMVSIKIPDSVKEIQPMAFQSCEKLKNIYLGTGLESVGNGAFWCCDSIEKVNIESISSWCGIDFIDGNNGFGTNPLMYADGLYLNGELVTEIIVPDDVKKIGSCVFLGYGSLREITISDSVTSIGEGAFQNCWSLETVTFGNNIKTVGSYAFAFCDALKKVNTKSIASWSQINFYDYLSTPLYYTEYLYLNDEAITEIVIPDGVIDIGSRAFYSCGPITKVVFPSSIKSVGEDAFAGCDTISSVYIGDLGAWSEIDFCNAQSNPLIGDVDLYVNNTVVDNLNIPEGTTHIGSYAFCCWYNSPQTITIPDSVKTIGKCAFESLSNLSTVHMSNNVEQIGEHAFWGCWQLKSIDIPSTTSVIGEGAFYGCNSLENITVDADNQYYTSENGVLFNKDKTILIQCSTRKGGIYEIPNSVISISDGAFYCCGSVVGIIIPRSVQHIGEEAICNCFSLSHIFFEGNEDEWNQIELDDYNYFDSVVFHYESSCDDIISQKDEATCTEKGSITYTCCICDTELFTSSLETVPHNKEVVESETPTCTTDGHIKFYCEMCQSYYTEWMSAPGHIKGDVIESVNPSCTQDGYTRYNCSVCSVAFTTDWVWAQGHTKDEIVSVVDPTCEESGYTIYSCPVCSLTFKSDWIYSDGHTSSDYITDKAATVNAAGSQHKECTECGEVLETAVIPQLTCATPTLSKAANANGGVTVTWKAVSGADSYRVYRKTSSTSWTCLNKKVTGTSYTDTTAKSGTTYYYTVKAENEAGVSGYNKTGVSVKYLAMPTVTVANASTGVKVSWNKITGASKYYVYRKASSEKSWTRLTDSATGTSYTDTKAKSGTTYYYTVKAVSGSVASAFKSSSALKYLAQPKVSSLSNTNSGITVKWNKITGASGYTVYRKASGDKSWTNLGNTTGTSFTDTKAKAGTTYYYTVRAYNGSVKSTYTSSTAIRRLTTPTLKSVTSAKSGITFKWNKVTGAEGYYVYRKTGSGDWKKIATVKSGSTVSYLDKTAKKGTTYTYTVRAYYESSVSYFNTTGLKIKDKY